MFLTTDNRSLAEKLAALPEDERKTVFADISDDELAALEYDWKFWARPNQLAPEGDWRIWMLIMGRGAGKTKAGSEWVREAAKKYKRIHLVGPTAGDVRDTMVEGPSGILAVHPKWERPLYEPSKRRITWPNGAVAHTFSAEEPERLRGPQCQAFWADELAAWSYLTDTWNMLMLGFRLPPDPRGVVTTTPKPLPLVRQLLEDDTVKVTRGSTFENIGNLADAFIRQVVRQYEGTRLGRQELYGEVLEDIEGALWSQGMLDATRVKERPDELQRIVVAVDPGATDDEHGAETGIIVAGIKMIDGELHGFVLEDCTLRGSPAEWGRTAVNAYKRHKADRIVGEVNNGGDMVEHTIKTVDPHVSFKKVSASRGKQTRAEPVAALSEQGRLHLVGSFPLLEDQLCSWVPGMKSPDRLDAMVWVISELMLGATPVTAINMDLGAFRRPSPWRI